jgi:hypothetical protein
MADGKGTYFGLVQGCDKGTAHVDDQDGHLEVSRVE